MKDLKSAYRRIMEDHFPDRMEISFVGESGRQTLFYEKATWVLDGEEKGLRYGENPGQEAALYRLVNGNLTLGEAHHDPARPLPGLRRGAPAVRQAPRARSTSRTWTTPWPSCATSPIPHAP